MHGDLDSMAIDDLWNLYEEISAQLQRKIESEKAKLEERLRRIETGGNFNQIKAERRPYPKVLPKYRNPKNSAETWSGRGKQPQWVRDQLRAGRKLDHFLIVRSSAQKARQTG